MLDYRKHIDDLRALYVKATPSQRYRAACDRIEHPDCGPNKLIQLVSAVEGLARTIAINIAASSGEGIENAYKRLRFEKPEVLISEYIAKPLGKTPEDLIGKDNWELFGFAVEYRNLLIHECTFLGQDTSNPMIYSLSKIFETLKQIANVH
jgi:hypothetical protein